MSSFDPTPEDVDTARETFVQMARHYTERFVSDNLDALIGGMVESCLTAAAETEHRDYADHCVRRARAYFVVLAEYRERGAR